MRGLIWTGATLGFSVIASGVVVSQTQGTLKPALLVTVQEPLRFPNDIRPAAVLARILSFDVNGDGRIARDELPERMETLVNRGDANEDGFLARDEVITLLNIPSQPRRIQRPQVPSAGQLTEILEDLKLPPATHEAALAAVKEHTVPHQINVSNELDAAMRQLLEAEDYENFMAAAARLRTTRRVVVRGRPDGMLPVMPPPPPPPPPSQIRPPR
jgi:hypothetical protein